MMSVCVKGTSHFIVWGEGFLRKDNYLFIEKTLIPFPPPPKKKSKLKVLD